MDSRDIKENPVLTEGLLEDMYKMQKALIDEYVKIEGLPPYPINVNKKANQIILKDFTGRVTEELAEGWESLEEVKRLSIKNNYWLNDYDVDEYNASLNHLQNFGEELSDAIHFFLELLIYANIEVEELLSYVKTKHKFVPSKQGDTLNFLMRMGYEKYIWDRYWPELRETSSKNAINVLRPIHEAAIECTHDIRYFKAGSKVIPRVFNIYKMVQWDITYHLNISRNFLKSKPWKQSEMMTSEIQYQEELVKAFLNFLGYLYMVTEDDSLMYFLYFKKNHVNKFRIKSKY